jgi:hypothetical protein
MERILSLFILFRVVSRKRQGLGLSGVGWNGYDDVKAHDRI